MPHRLLRALAPLVVVAALVLAGRSTAAQEADLYTAALVDDASLPLEAQVLPPAAGSCQDLESEEIRLAFEPVAIDAPGPRGRPDLCLLHREYDDIYRVVMLPINSADHFRAAKDAAIRMLEDVGFDLCSIGGWNAYGLRATSLTPDDLFTVPAVCAPRVRTLTADTQIAAVIGDVEDAVLELAALTAQQMAWQPNRALTVLATMDPEVTVDLHRRSITSLPAAEVERRARDGRSVTGTDAFAGPRILLNFSRTAASAERRGQSLVLEARFEATVFIAHEYTHFAQAGIGGANGFFPMWFIEGQATYQEERNSGVRPFYQDEATRLVRMNRGLRLSEISERDDWFRQEARAGSNSVYSRAYAAVALLVERHGFDATVQLLRDNKDGSLDRFDSLLAALTGQNLEGFDATLNGWLQSAPTTTVPPPVTTAPPTTGAPPTTPPASPPPATTQPPTATTPAPPNARYSGTDSANRVRIEFTVSSNGRLASGDITVLLPIPCGGGRALAPGAGITFQYPIRADGGFSGSPTSGSAIVTIDVRIQGTAAEGAFTYTDPSIGCDTGRITFTARATP